MPKTPEQYDDIRKQRKQLIMDTALELFAENGYHATSISQIAKMAGISKGLTYNYFRSKNEILKEIMDQGFNEIYDNLDINKDGILTEEEFIYFIRRNFQLVKENTHYWKLFFSLLLQPRVSETFATLYQQQGEPIFKMFYQFIVSNGSKEPESDLMAVASMIEGAFLYLVTAPDIFPGEQLEQAVINSSLKIIKNQQHDM
jgi:AcrR family transcriptional regulator